MKKRIVSFILVLNFLLVFILGRLYFIAESNVNVYSDSSKRTKLIDERRGFFYDRNLEPFVNNSYSFSLLIKPTPKAFADIKNNINNKAVIESLSKGYFTVFSTSNYYDFKNEDIKTIKKFNRYNSDSLCHIIGYLDNTNNGIYGLEKYYNKEITNYGGKISAIYEADALGQMMTGENVEIRDENYYSNEGIVLTIDKKIQKITERALKSNNIDKGAAVVLDINSFEIIASASTPTFDRNNIYKSTQNKDLPFLNRSFSAFPVGSVFKVVTSAAAFENNIYLNKFNCTGHITKSGNIFYCSKLDGHKKIDFNTALSKSCNPYFIELGNLTGGENILKTAKALGFGKATCFVNGYYTDKGTLPELKELNSAASIGNLSFGQGKLTATPLQIASLFAVIGNNGYYKEPSLIKGKVDSNFGYIEENKKEPRKVLKTETCEKISNALKLTTLNGTGKKAFSSLFDACTKTATAQSGKYDENGREIKYCWFAGFFPADKPKYAICILKENGSSGGTDGGPVFKEISENIYIYNKINQLN